MRRTELIDKLTSDEFIGGRVVVEQPRTGYRANIDSVLLSAAVSCGKGDTILELGCGAGTILFCLMARVKGLKAYGVEIQERYAELARSNAKRNMLKVNIVTADICSLPVAIKKIEFDNVVLNPPFNRRTSSYASNNKEQDISKREFNPDLPGWIDIAIKRCKVKGEIVIIHQIDRLGEILTAFADRVGDITILPVVSFRNENAKKIIVKCRKGTRGLLKLCPPLVVHKKTPENLYSDSYTSSVKKILKNGHPLKF